MNFNGAFDAMCVVIRVCTCDDVTRGCRQQNGLGLWLWHDALGEQMVSNMMLIIFISGYIFCSDMHSHHIKVFDVVECKVYFDPNFVSYLLV